MKRVLFILFTWLFIYTSQAANNPDELKDPVALGAWLYQSRCISCHRSYDVGRVASDYDDHDELTAAIGEEECQITWSRKTGGEFGNRELAALASYMMAWEESGKEPELPQLPALLPSQRVITVAPREQKNKEKEASHKEDGPVLGPALKQVIQKNPVANGGWLYTTNCYRCHLGYEKARMGRGISIDAVARIISEGKTSTQMKPFSMMLGGNLKNSEIKAIAGYIDTWERSGEPPAIAMELMTPPSFSPTDFLPIRLPRFKEVTGDAVAGKKIFQSNCTSCHGQNAKGYYGPSLKEKPGSLRPDLYTKSILQKGVPRSIMKPWDVNRGGILSTREISDLVSYIISLHHDPHNLKSDLLKCQTCHKRPQRHKTGECRFCHDTVDWGHAS